MAGSTHKNKRIISVVAGTLVALACGTNYAYSAWAPQFASRMKLSSTQSNLIGAAGNLGMYASGVPLGVMIDGRGPRLAIFLGALAVGVGYYPLHVAYEKGQGSIAMPLLLIFAFLTGLGSCSGFSAAIKTVASNFPDHRGTATAFPLSAFGLSAFFWSTVSTITFKDDTGRFLLLLALGTSLMILLSSFFIRIYPIPGSYSSLPSHEPEARPLRRTKSTESRVLYDAPAEAGMQSSAFEPSTSGRARSQSRSSVLGLAQNAETEETSSLVSKLASHPENELDEEEVLTSGPEFDTPHPDVRGLALLPKVEFWQLFLIMGLLSGIGLMTINNIGNSVRALWKYYDDSVDSKFIMQRQVMHVSVLSICSFLGRLLSGIGSDLLVKKLNMSRFWCLFFSAVLFTVTQLAGSSISEPHELVLISGATGLAYGFLFGVYPSLVAHTFGINGLTQNWGIMTLAPVFSGNIFNLLYGAIYDRHSVVSPDGERDCREGLSCYKAAYYTTFFSGLAGIGVTLWSIWQERRVHGARLAKPSHDRIA
ncbi:hypothetical protein DTO166G4_5528 [Paecilomyces variotii]|uniref:Major facilitator superfamily domain-containing protein n=1 Tax=Byssochlamys spectabilis TaxID=264951 RepID=A0A443HTR2_BYSSP|nr:major facilitator superfamily domain-containing protein [Paecilomyces variotii]KAJ9212871.1 hypothetical protein DTO166G4_5528 [Paecilomyces variotii]KAJ9241588.1 hypothetical protein DTO166G5_1209 [Paecilomyces variotii]KAJ9262086.1 hypothetical protein DTO195F2_3788 [Paecilomyces variotii]KAJ9363985.1 hypothetical protein DTO280E4_2207 [Paecilomyces variotii]KAJ9369004.1 hypothetical protein DTO282E5_6336 [Paecilomyces variotii]